MCLLLCHYSDVIMSRWRLKTPVSRLFAQPFIRAHIKENIKALRHWLLWGETTDDRWIHKGTVTRKMLHLMTSSCSALWCQDICGHSENQVGVPYVDVTSTLFTVNFAVSSGCTNKDTWFFEKSSAELRSKVSYLIIITIILLIFLLSNSSPPSAAYMRQWTGPALVQIMACRLFGAKPLSEPMLEYC